MVSVVAKYVNMPKEGKKFGNIKTAEGELFWATADKLRQVQRGATVEVDFEDQTWGDKDVHVIKMIKVTGAPRPSAGGGGAHDGAPWQVPNFVSNVVGQAITAGLIKDPNDIKRWTAAAMLAGKEVLAPVEQRTQPPQGRSDEPPPASYGDYH